MDLKKIVQWMCLNPPNIKTARRQNQKIGRNDLCPCDSKMKYKHCHWPAFNI